MLLGRVVGHVWTTKKNRRLERHKLLIIKPYGWYNPSYDISHIVAIDHLDAGVGDDVLVCYGAPPRWSVADANMPVEAAVMGIVDKVSIAEWALNSDVLPIRFIDDERPKRLDFDTENKP